MNNKIIFKIIDTPNEYQILDIFLSGNGIIQPSDLKHLKLPDNINFEKGVIINGRAPIWLYAYLIHELHISSFVGIYDPRLGGIIVQKHKSINYEVGDIIPNKEILEFIKMSNETLNIPVIAFIGPPHSGKSLLLQVLKKQLKSKLTDDFFQRDFFVVRGCPDGEGDWSAESDSKNVKLIRYKNNFDNEFVEKVINDIKNLRKSKKLVFVDCGGKIDRYNQLILNECSHCIIVSNKQMDIYEWIGLAKSCNNKILAIIESQLEKVSELISKDEPLRLKIGYLGREIINEIQLPDILVSSVVKLIRS